MYHIRSVTSDFDIIPEHKVRDNKTEILVHNQIVNAGNYNLFVGKEPITGLSFNFNRKESDLNCYNAEELNGQLTSKNFNNVRVIETGSQSMQQALMDIEQGKKLWKWCIVLALLFLATEALLLRFMK